MSENYNKTQDALCLPASCTLPRFDSPVLENETIEVPICVFGNGGGTFGVKLWNNLAKKDSEKSMEIRILIKINVSSAQKKFF